VLVHVLDGGLVDQGLRATADLEGIAVVPLDAAFDAFAVFKHDDHAGLRLNLLLQVEELGMAVRSFVLHGVCGKVDRQWDGRRLP